MGRRRLIIEIEADLIVPGWFYPLAILLVLVSALGIILVDSKLVVGLSSVLLFVSVLVAVLVGTASEEI